MRILHVASDWKWTGPAAPLLALAAACSELGHEVALACPEAPGEGRSSLADEARRAGLEPVLQLDRARGARPWRDARDARALASRLRAHPVDVVHAWHTRDHVLALRARRRAGARGSAVVRSTAATRPPRDPAGRWLLGPGGDGVLCVSPRAAAAMAPLRRGRPTAAAPGAVDLAVFRPGAPDPAVRRGLGLRPEHRVVGVVARVQRHRRFDLLLSAAARLFAEDPLARLLVVGRGTHREALAERPARELGIADRVVFAGYRRADYADVLRAVDVFTLLVPGSDGGCRALQEAQACGLPAVTTARGALPELVRDGETGALAAEEPGALAGAWLRLLRDPARRRRLGAAARASAERDLSPRRYAERTLALYGDALRM